MSSLDFPESFNDYVTIWLRQWKWIIVGVVLSLFITVLKYQPSKVVGSNRPHLVLRGFVNIPEAIEADAQGMMTSSFVVAKSAAINRLTGSSLFKSHLLKFDSTLAQNIIKIEASEGYLSPSIPQDVVEMAVTIKAESEKDSEKIFELIVKSFDYFFSPTLEKSKQIALSILNQKKQNASDIKDYTKIKLKKYIDQSQFFLVDKRFPILIETQSLDQLSLKESKKPIGFALLLMMTAVSSLAGMLAFTILLDVFSRARVKK
jgi:hypothetical protein